MEILNQTKSGEIGRVLLEQEWLTHYEINKLDEIKKSGLEITE